MQAQVLCDDRYETVVLAPWSILRLNQFVIREPVEKKDVRQKAMTVLKTLRDNLFGTYELHGYGREAVKGVDLVTELLNVWITVVQIDTGCDNQIIVHFKRAPGFFEGHKKAMKMARKVGPAHRMRAYHTSN